MAETKKEQKKTGFANVIVEEMEDTMTLDEYLIDNKESAYMLRVETDAMQDEGILRGDLIIVDRGATPKNGDLIVALVDDSYHLKRFDKKSKKEIQVEAVVKSVIRKY